MEKLKSVISQTLKHSISQGNPDTLPDTCSSLHDFFDQLPQFHQMLRDLAHKETSLFAKNEESALEFKLKGNNCFSNGDDSNALRFYTQALRVVPREKDDTGKNLMATLYVNRAAVLQKMGLVVESIQDCNQALAVCSSYSKAWYRRGKANISMGNYHDAVCDLKVSLCMERSLSGKRQIEGELKLILDRHNVKDFSQDVANYKKSDINDHPQQTHMQCVSTETKGRGMVSLTDIPKATLLHTEEPYAAIISKHCRETHCHFCFNELPADIVPCPSCSMSLYCSQLCQIRARGQASQYHLQNHEIKADLSSDLENYVHNVTRASVSSVHMERYVEHKHECGVNWPAALPAQIVLAGRVIVKSIEQNRHSGVSSSIVNLDLCHSYVQLSPEAKLELHITSIVLLHCLHNCYHSDFPINGNTISQCVLLLTQLKVNSMAIIRMRSSDTTGNRTTSTIEQVRVGEAIYLAGSLFNHSCEPNIHTYFLSRTLYIRATDFVAMGQPLELSYGPQVGEWSCNDRQLSLKEQYSFVCRCSGCSRLNLSDIVISSFRCLNLDCSGVVLDGPVANYEKHKVNPCCHGLPLKVGGFEHDEIKKVAGHLSEETGSVHRIKPGFCLSCGAYCDLEASNTAVKKAEASFRRLEEALDCVEVPTKVVSNALTALDLLKSAAHPYNKKVAQMEDYLAQAFCSIKELQRAKDHCQASIKVLEKLYGDEHIVIGNELLKLSSIRLALNEDGVEESINRIDNIFSRYYGSHLDLIFPNLRFLDREASKAVR